MLILTRKAGEEIVIGRGEIIIRVVEIGLGKIRLGITAAKHVPVNRREVWEKIKDALPEPGGELCEPA